MGDPNTPYDQDAYGFDVENDRYEREPTEDELDAMEAYEGYEPAWNDQYGKAQRDQALVNEEILRWEHELAQPSYYDYFLEEVTR